MNAYEPNREVSKLAEAVLFFLKSRAVGKENAVKISAFEFYLESSRRYIEKATEELRGAGIPLCSNLTNPKGLFLARDYGEALAWVRQIERRMKNMAIHKAQALKGLKALADRDGIQLDIFIPEEKGGALLPINQITPMG